MKKAVKHPTKKGMGGHIRAQDWNYYPSDNPRIRESHKEHVEQSLARFEEIRQKGIDAQVEKWQRNPPKSPEGYPHPEVRELGYWPGEDWRASSWRPSAPASANRSAMPA